MNIMCYIQSEILTNNNNVHFVLVRIWVYAESTHMNTADMHNCINNTSFSTGYDKIK